MGHYKHRVSLRNWLADYVEFYVAVINIWFAGDNSKWLITTWDQISNKGAAYGDNSPRKMLKSSGSTTGMKIDPELVHRFNLIWNDPTAVDRKWRNNNGVPAEPWITL
jgi:hypothetical protein